MFERFTDRARRVVVLAQEEARMLAHNYIGTEHILLGLLHEGEGVAAKSLVALGISLDGVRERTEAIIGRGQASPSGHIPFTPRAKKVFELSLREALQLGHNYIGTEHIMLGLIREGEGVGAQVLVHFGGDLARYRQEVIRQLTYPSQPPPPTWTVVTPSGDEVLAESHEALVAALELEAEIGRVRLEKERLIDAQDFDGAAEAHDRVKKLSAKRKHASRPPRKAAKSSTIRRFSLRSSQPVGQRHERAGIQLTAAGVPLAEGAEFSDGRIALRWTAAPQSSIWLDNLTQMKAVFPQCPIDWFDE